MLNLTINRILLLCVLFVVGCEGGLPELEFAGAEARVSGVILGSATIGMTIQNNGNGGDVLVSARTNMTGTVLEFHDVSESKMVKVRSIKVPAKGYVELKSGAQHIMLYGIPKDRRHAETITIYLNFEKSGEKKVVCKAVR